MTARLPRLPFEIWLHILDQVDDFELWISTRLVCRHFNECIKQRFRSILYPQSECEISINFLEDEQYVGYWRWEDLVENDILRPLSGDDHDELVNSLPDGLFGAEGRGDRLVWIYSKSRHQNRKRESRPRPEEIKYTPSPYEESNPFGTLKSVALLTMFQTVDPERRIFRSSGNISAERRNKGDEIRDDWLIFIAADETESGDNGGPPVKAVALTIPLSHLVRMVFEHVAQNDKEQKERESRERKRKRGNRRRRRGW